MEENNNIENNNETNKLNSKKNINIILVVVALLVSFSIGYLIATNAFSGDNGKNENKKEENETNDKVEKPTFDINTLYYGLHESKDETDDQVGLESTIYNKEEIYVKEFTSKELYLILQKYIKENGEKYIVEGSGPTVGGTMTTDPGYDYLLEYEPVRKLLEDYTNKLFGENLSFSDNFLVGMREGAADIPCGCVYYAKEIDGKKYYTYAERAGGCFSSPSYKYQYEKTVEGNNEVYVYEKVQVVNYGETNPIASYTYKWTYKIGNDNQYHLYKINRE